MIILIASVDPKLLFELLLLKQSTYCFVKTVNCIVVLKLSTVLFKLSTVLWCSNCHLYCDAKTVNCIVDCRDVGLRRCRSTDCITLVSKFTSISPSCQFLATDVTKQIPELEARKLSGVIVHQRKVLPRTIPRSSNVRRSLQKIQRQLHSGGYGQRLSAREK